MTQRESQTGVIDPIKEKSFTCKNSINSRGKKRNFFQLFSRSTTYQKKLFSQSNSPFSNHCMYHIEISKQKHTYLP